MRGANLVTTSDNCAAQFRSRYHFAWMVDYVEESEYITTFLAIYLAEYHGKGLADSAAGGAKTKADEAAVYGTSIETAYDLYVFLNTHYKQVLNTLQFIANWQLRQMSSSAKFYFHTCLKYTGY